MNDLYNIDLFSGNKTKLLTFQINGQMKFLQRVNSVIISISLKVKPSAGQLQYNTKSRNL